MARLSVAAGPFTILPPPHSRFPPLAPYCYTPLPAWHPTGPLGWHPTAIHLLAPYCSSLLAGIPSAQWLRSRLYPPRSLDFLGYTLSWYCTASVTFANALDGCNSHTQPLMVNCGRTPWFSHVPVSLPFSVSPSGAFGKNSFV